MFQKIATIDTIHNIQQKIQHNEAEALSVSLMEYCSNRLSYNYSSHTDVFFNQYSTRLDIFKFRLKL